MSKVSSFGVWKGKDWEATPRPYEDVRLIGDEEGVTGSASRMSWLLHRYTSVCYVERISLMLGRFVDGFELWAKAQHSDGNTKIARAALRGLYHSLAELQGGFELLQAGDKRVAFLRLYEGLHFEEVLVHPRFRFGEVFEFLGDRGDRPAVGLYSWYETACKLARPVVTTLRAHWTYSELRQHIEHWAPRFPEDLAPFGDPIGERVETGAHIPVSGVWMPLNLKGACPNYLVEGKVAPMARHPVVRRDYVECVSTYDDSLCEAYSELIHKDRPAVWGLMAADERYTRGASVDESAFMSPETDFPKYLPDPFSDLDNDDV